MTSADTTSNTGFTISADGDVFTVTLYKPLTDRENIKTTQPSFPSTPYSSRRTPQKKRRFVYVLIPFLFVAFFVTYYAAIQPYMDEQIYASIDSEYMEQAATGVGCVSLKTYPLTSRPYYTLLDSQDQEAYQALYETIALGKSSVQITSSNYNMILDYLRNDCPELFYIDSDITITSSGGTSYTVHLTYNQAGTWETSLAEIQSKAALILSNIDETWDTETKISYIHDWLCKNVSYDSTAASDPAAIQFSNQQNVYGALVEGSAVCGGYAHAFEYLCQCLDIPCKYVSGVGYTSTGAEPHAWNSVLISGEWLDVDVTWDDQDQTGQILHEWYLLPDEDFSATHVAGNYEP